ncbi:MAG: terminase small subunit [Bacteroidota bacterium]
MKAKKRPKAGTSKAEAAKRRALFVEAYIANGGNATQAAITAGYSEKSARRIGTRLSTDVHISAEIETRRAQAIAQAEESTGLTIRGVLKELAGIVHSDLRGAFNSESGALLAPKDWPDSVARSIASVKVVEMAGGMAIGGEAGASHVPMYTKEVKLWDKNSAIDKAMKYLGLYEKDNEQKPAAAVLMPGVRTVKFEPIKGRSKTASA